jgi:8-amino-7-oxononanoate synthase
MELYRRRLRELKEAGLFRTIRDRTGPQGPRVVLEGRELVSFCSNDYLGLATHPALKEAAQEALKQHGSGSGAARLLAGGSELHRRLELQTASFKGLPRALLFGSGYLANVGVLPALEADFILSDELNHASIIDGCRLSRAQVLVYRHLDTEHLKELLRSTKGRRLIVSESLFSMDGDLAPLGELYALARQYDALLVVDEAHATGVLGGGRGSRTHLGLQPWEGLLEVGTYSKALGSYGAFVAASEELTQWLANRARSFMFSTALPPSVVAASLKALQLLRSQPELQRRLWENTRFVLRGLRDLGLELGPTESPIVPVLFDTVQEALRASERLLEEGILAPAIRPPTVPRPRLRLTITAAHSRQDLQRLLQALKGL